MTPATFVSITNWQPYLVALVLYFIIGGALLVVKLASPRERYLYLGTILTIGLIFRVIAARELAAFPFDFSTFFAWSEGIVQHGFAQFYNSQRFIDYPPGYMYILYVIGEIRHGLGIVHGTAGSALLLKAPAILADLGIAYVLYQVGRERHSERWGAIAAMLYFLNPVSWLNSAVWGQVDSVFALALLLSLWQLGKKNFTTAGIGYAIAILIKPQALLFGPVFLFIPIGKQPLQAWGKMVFAGVLTFILGILPFSMNQDPLWIYNLYKNTLSSYAYYSVNAFNVPAMLGGNWQALSANASILSSVTLACIVIAVGLYAWQHRHSENREGQLALWLILTVFLFAFKMHERYLFPAIVLIPYVWIRTKNMRWGIVLALVTIAQFINVGLIYIQSLMGNQPLLFGQSAINTCAGLLFLAWAMTTWYLLANPGGVQLDNA
jgi:dolichyl-phosphate-mannose-protein mannosyltransferase